MLQIQPARRPRQGLLQCNDFLGTRGLTALWYGGGVVSKIV